MTREEREMELWTSVYGMHLHANPKEAADYALDSFRAKFPTEPATASIPTMSVEDAIRATQEAP